MSRPRFPVAVVTGAASGIGLALARALTRDGSRVHLADIDTAGLDRAVAEVRALGAPAATAHVLDCADAAAIGALADAVYRQDGRADLLVNNAGITRAGPFDATTDDDWRRVMDVDFWGVVHGVRTFAPRMAAQPGGGTIVNTASAAGLVGLPMIAPYTAAKFAVVGLTESLAPELAVRGVHLMSVCPGMVRTRVFESAAAALPGRWNDVVTRAMDLLAADPDDVARRILAAAARRDPLLVVAAGWMKPLWWLHRASPRGYGRLVGGIVKVAIGGRAVGSKST